MESKFKVGDLVWAKMKGFPAWPAKVIEPKEEVRRPSDKKPKKFVYFFGSENYAWIPADSMWQYVTNKERFNLTHRIPRGFREAIEAVDDALKSLPEQKYLQLQGRKSPRQGASPVPPGVQDKQTLQVSKDRQHITSRRDRALKRRSSLDNSRLPTKRQRSQSDTSLSRKSLSVDSAAPQARHKAVRVDVGGSGDTLDVGKSLEEKEEEEEEDSEVTLRRPNGGGDYMRGESEENGVVTPNEGSVTEEEVDNEVTLRKPVGGDALTQKVDDDEVVLRKPDDKDDTNVDTQLENSGDIEGECVEIGLSSDGKSGEERCIMEEHVIGVVSVDVATEEVVQCTMNSDLMGADEIVETTMLSQDLAVSESAVGSGVCDEGHTEGESLADECNDEQQEEQDSPEVINVPEHSSAYETMQHIIASLSTQEAMIVGKDASDASTRSSVDDAASCGTEEKDSDSEEVRLSGDEDQHPKMRTRQEKEIKEIKDTQSTEDKKEEAKLKKIQDRKSREFQAAMRTKPPPRKRPLSSPISLSSTITPKRSKLPATKPLSLSTRKSNSLTGSSPSTTQNDFKPILEIMQQQSKMPRLSDTEDQDDREDDYSERLADLSGIDFSLPHIPRTKNIIATPMKIGFLGLGAMGSGMVTNLLNSGHEVTVWNRTPSSCREFVKIGALKGNSPSEVITSCDMTFSCVSDPSALKDLVFGNCGVLQGIGPGKAYIDMSTVDVETITDVHEAVTTRGGRFLEAPVIGSRQPAMAGQLLILAAGDRTLFDDCYSCLEAMGRQTFFLGEVGSATKMKLVISMLMGTVLAGLAESMALAEHIGLDQEEVLKILTLSPVSCPLIRTKGNAMMQAQFSNPHCRLHLCQKDLRLAVNMSDTVEQPLHVASAVNELFKKAKAKGYGEHDSAAVYRAADL